MEGHSRKDTRVRVRFRTHSGKTVSFLAKPKKKRSVRPKDNRKVVKSRSK